MFVVFLNTNKNFIQIVQTAVFSEKRKYSNHTLKSMSAKHRYVENMTFLSRFERVRAQAPASIETKER